MTRTAYNATLASLAALVALAAIIAADFTPPASAQSGDETAGRIVARLLEDGRVEFGWQPASGERVLPRSRYFPADATVDRWLRSSPVEVGDAEIGRINARLLSDGRIEFGFTPMDGERIAPEARYFPTNARVGRWLRSTEIAIGAPTATAGYVAVSASEFHSCAILASSGTIECWGDNFFGKTTAPEGSFTAVSAGRSHTCAIRDTGEIACWGGSLDFDSVDAGGQRIETGKTTAPEGSFTTVSAGANHNCAIRTSEEIACWGRNYRPYSDDVGEIQRIETGQTDAPEGSFTAVSVADDYTCAIRDTGEIVCWGLNGDGQTDAPEGSFIAISGGSAHTCAIRTNGEIACWGLNGDGQSDAPEGSFTAVSAGTYHNCAIRATTGAIECWGSNYDHYRDGAGQIQRNETGPTDAPDGKFTAVSAGFEHTCAIRENGAIECWGRNTYGQATPDGPPVPEGSFTAISAGSDHTCAIRTNGEIECWVLNGDRQTDAPEGSFTAVSTGWYHTCAIGTGSGAVECWGDDEYGETDAPEGSFSAVSTGWSHTCAIGSDDGAIQCWGLKGYQTLNPDTGERGVQENGQTNAPDGNYTAVSTGAWHSCAIRAGSGALECWGSIPDYGETGRTPQGSYIAVGASRYSSCAIHESGEITCWGWDQHSTGKLNAPGGSYTAVSAGHEHFCAIRASGGIECWGYNEDGRSDAPEGSYTAVAAGSAHTCAIRASDSAIECWGNN